MKDDFSKYESLRDSGSSPEKVYQQAVKDGIDPITRIRLIRAVFALSPAQAKEVIVQAEGDAASLDQHQENIANAIAKHSQKPSRTVSEM